MGSILSTLLMLLGYTLVYSAVAKQGKYATDPMKGLTHDAYGDSSAGSSPGAAPGSPGKGPQATPAPANPIPAPPVPQLPPPFNILPGIGP